MDDIFNYEHPFLTVDGVIFRIHDGDLEVLLIKRNDEYGEWSLPGGFVPIEERAQDTLHRMVKEKTGVSGFYEEQLKTYDSLDRDPRARVISIAYLGIIHDDDACGEWFQISNGGKGLIRGETLIYLGDLAFDHGEMILEALDRIRGKLWWSDLPRYFIPNEFTIRELETVFTAFSEGQKLMNFRRQIDGRIKALDKRTSTGGRPAQLFHWVEKGWDKHAEI